MFVRWKRRGTRAGWALDAVLVTSQREARVDSVGGRLRHRRVPRLTIVATLGTLSERFPGGTPSPALRRRVEAADPALYNGERTPRSMRELMVLDQMHRVFEGHFNGEKFLARATERVVALNLGEPVTTKIVAALTAKIAKLRPKETPAS